MDPLELELKNLQAFCNECKILMGGSYQPEGLDARYEEAKSKLLTVQEKIRRRDANRDDLITR